MIVDWIAPVLGWTGLSVVELLLLVILVVKVFKD